MFKLPYLFQTCDKTACKCYETYKSYDYCKKAYKHDTYHDIAKQRHSFEDFYVNTECFSKNICFKVIFKTRSINLYYN